MNRISLVSLAVLLGTSAFAASASAAEPIEQVVQYGENAGATRVGQVTSVSQLSDVKPSDWAFQSLQSLVERYGCVVGYPDKTYRGNRALTRYEFAAGLNSCMDRVNELIAASKDNGAAKEDAASMQKLQAEFADELSTLQGKVDGLDYRTETLEKKQFSTTTKLTTEVIFAAAGLAGQNKAVAVGTNPTSGSLQNDTSTIVGNRVRVNFDASTDGTDRLRVRLQARNISQFNGTTTGTNQTRLGFDGVSANSANTVELSRLEYRFAPTPKTTVYLGGGTNDGLEINDMIPTLSPTESSANGSISRFGRYNPIYRAGTGTGVVINQKLNDATTASVGYLANTSNAASTTAGAFNLNGSDRTAFAQIALKPTDHSNIAITYADSSYTGGSGVSGGTGTTKANTPFTDSATTRTAAKSYGLEGELALSKAINLSGWAGYTEANQVTQATGARAGYATSWNWAVAATFPDLFKEGNLGGIIYGQPPHLTALTTTAGAVGAADQDPTHHIEAFYRWRLNDKMSITPGLFVIVNPEGNKANSAIYVGTVRTTFTF
jgi:Carbohydrate-selective porin, OprB family/S-layer homology domain